MTALTRYHASLLLRSHRWIPPALLYVLGVLGLGGTSQPFGAGLDPALNWAALMLVPVAAWLTRSMLTAEPSAARACVAAAAGPGRTQVSALLAALGIGAAFGFVGIAWELIMVGVVRDQATHAVDAGATAGAVGGGLLAMLICLLVGSAIGALFNPPVVRQSGAAILTTAAAVVAALAWNMSPANAALRSPQTGVPASRWPTGVPLIAAIALVAVAWLVSVQFARHREA